MSPDLPPAPPAPWGAVVSVQTDRFSDPLPLADLLASRLSGLRARHQWSLAYARDEVRVSAWGPLGLPSWLWPQAQDTRWQLSALARQSATLVASRGAVALTQDIAADGAPARSYQADVSLRLRGYAGYGIDWAVQGASGWPGGQLRWQLGVQTLRLLRLMTRDITGQVRFDAATSSYTTRLESDQFNDRHHYLYQTEGDTQGWAWLAHWQLQWQASPDWAWSVGVSDIGRLHWDRLAHEQRTLDTDVTRTDSAGNVSYAPLLQGRDGQDRLTLMANATVVAGMSWQWQSGQHIELSARHLAGMQPWLPYSGVRVQGGDWQWQLGWRWHERAAQVGLQHGPWQMHMAGDALDSRARTRQFSLQWQQAW